MKQGSWPYTIQLLLMSRGELLEQARQKVVESGYQFKKGKSRSKKLNPDQQSVVPRLSKINFELRQRRMKELKDDIMQLDEEIAIKHKRREQAESIRNYKLCDELTEEMGRLKKQCRELQNELKAFERKEKKAQWYQNRKHKSAVAESSQVEANRIKCQSSDMDSDCPLTSPPSVSSVASDTTVILSDSDVESDWLQQSSQQPPSDIVSSQGVAPFPSVVVPLPPSSRQALFRPLSPRAVTPSPSLRQASFRPLSPRTVAPSPPWSQQGLFRPLSPRVVTPSPPSSRQASFCPLSPSIVTPPPPSREGSFEQLSPRAVTPSSLPWSQQGSFRPLSPRAVTPSPPSSSQASFCPLSPPIVTPPSLSRQGSFKLLSPRAVTPNSPPWSKQGLFRPLSPRAVTPSPSSRQASFRPYSPPFVTPPPSTQGSFELLSPRAVTPSSPPWSQQGSFKPLSPQAVTVSPQQGPLPPQGQSSSIQPLLPGAVTPSGMSPQPDSVKPCLPGIKLAVSSSPLTESEPVFCQGLPVREKSGQGGL